MIESIKQSRFGRRTLFAAVLAIALVAVIAPSAAGAQLGGPNEEQVGPGNEFSVEIEFYVKEFNVSPAEAERRLIRSRELKALMLEIVTAEEGRIAGWGTVHEPQFGGWVYLVGDAPPNTATAAIQRENADIFIELGAAYTLAELQDARNLRSSWEPIPESMRERIAWTDIDIRANSLVVAIDRDMAPVDLKDGGQLGPEAIEALPLPDAAAALQKLLEADTGISFVVTLGTRDTPDSIYGGEHLDIGGNKYCTSAFAVVSGGTRGLLTAGHCSGPWRHWRSRTTSHTGSDYSVSGQDVVNGNDGDSQWYTSSEDESDNFYITTTLQRDTSGTEDRANMYGDIVCHYGVHSGNSCGTVVSTSSDPHRSACSGWPFYCADIWVKVEGDFLIRCGGDSGGPWFAGRVAYGVHSGGSGDESCTWDGTDYATFTAIDDIEDELGVTVVNY